MSTSEKDPVKYDEIENAWHYDQHPSDVKVIRLTRHLSNNMGNAAKYLLRAGLKEGSTVAKDTRKAAYYLEDEYTHFDDYDFSPKAVECAKLILAFETRTSPLSSLLAMISSGRFSLAFAKFLFAACRAEADLIDQRCREG